MMSAKNLRDSILQMAVEGKLVEQRKEEGTAEDLLASIREQRAQLVREKKAKPVKGGESVIWRDDDGHWFERRGKGEAVCIDDEIPFDIPDSWCWARFASCSMSLDYKRIPLSKKQRQNLEKIYPYYGATGEIDKVDKFIFDDELLLIGEDGANLISKARPLAFIVKGKYWVNNHAHCVDAIFKPMLAWLCLSINSKDISAMVRGTAQPKFNQAMLDGVLISIPPLEEQYRIVTKLERLGPLVDGCGKAQEQRERLDRDLPIKLRKSILQAAVEGKLTEQSDDDESASVLLAGIREKRAQLVREGKAKPVKGGESIIYRNDAGHWFERRGKSDPVCIDEEIPFDIPDTWCWARLNSLATLTRGSGIKRSEVREEGLPCVRYGELYTTYDTAIDAPHSFVDQAVFDAAKKIGPSDLVLTLTGENDIDIGRAVINRTGETIAFGGDLLSIADTQMDREYLLVALHSPALGKQRTQAAAGNIIVHLGAEKVGRFLIPIPPLAEQGRIEDKLAILKEMSFEC